MSTKLNCSILPSSILTPSTIQCTRFYSDVPKRTPFYRKQDPYCASTEMKRFLPKDHRRIIKSATMPLIKPRYYNAPRLLNRSSQTYACLENNLAENLQPWLPSRISVSSKWSLVYSLDQHGASLSTLYNRTSQNRGPCLLVIQDSNDEIFGAYLSEGVHMDTSCYGTGECFLWKQNKTTKMVIVYPWTMINDYLVYSNGDFFAVGGGQGKFGLWLHSDLTHGYTESCGTFNNPSLTIDSSFECVALEIWDFQY
ncbi:TLD-domain-containing protein [Thamnidium elegans]|nr:TLD-domain-containing protein [Thamnidium elegans]